MNSSAPKLQQGVSVIICCYNSERRLPPTLEALSKQSPWQEGAYEIVLVDNACTDQTVAIAQKLWQEYGAPFPLRVVEEQIPGQAFARVKGLKEAAYAFSVFCDDDNWLASGYLSVAARIMTENPEIGILGGYSIPASDVALPYWFTTYQAYYAIGVQGLYSGDITGKGLIWGAGMVLRTKVYHNLVGLGFRTIMQGRTGEQLSGGDDSELCYWYMAAGYKLWYSNELQLKHYMDAFRLTKDYFQQLKESSYTSYLRVFTWEAVLLTQKNNNVLLRFFYFIAFLAAGLITRKPKLLTQAAAYNPFPFGPSTPEVKAVKGMLNNTRLFRPDDRYANIE